MLYLMRCLALRLLLRRSSSSCGENLLEKLWFLLEHRSQALHELLRICGVARVVDRLLDAGEPRFVAIEDDFCCAYLRGRHVALAKAVIEEAFLD